MDLSFARNLMKPAAVSLRLDYPRLVAILTSVQGASRTAQIAGRVHAGSANGAGDGMVALFDPGCDWIAVAAALGGSFNPRVARFRHKAV